MKKTVKKLRLHRETLRALQSQDLAQVPGGSGAVSDCVCPFSVDTYGCATVEFVDTCAYCNTDAC